VSLAVQAHDRLIAEGIRSRVVSMPSWDIFEHQTQEYRDSVLPPAVKARVAVEQASAFGWSVTSAALAMSSACGLRGFRAPEGPSGEVRVRTRSGRGGGQGAAGQTVSECGSI